MATKASELETPPPAPPYTSADPNAIPMNEATRAPNQQPMYPQQQQQQQVYVTPLERLGEEPDIVDCPFCQRRVKTRVSKEDSGTTMGVGVLLCLVCICLACLPCILGWAQNVDHWCTNCNKQLTHKHHDSPTTIVAAAKERMNQNQTQAYGPAPGQVQSHYDGNVQAPPQAVYPQEAQPYQTAYPGQQGPQM